LRKYQLLKIAVIIDQSLTSIRATISISMRIAAFQTIAGLQTTLLFSLLPLSLSFFIILFFGLCCHAHVESCSFHLQEFLWFLVLQYTVGQLNL